MDPVQINPKLERQLESADPAMTVGVLIYLRPPEGAVFLEDTALVEKLAHKLVERVSAETGQVAIEVNVFRFLATFFVSASSTFVRHLVRQPEVAAAVANDVGEPPLTKTTPKVAASLSKPKRAS